MVHQYYMWVALSLLAAVLTATRDPIYKKLLVADVNPYILGSAQFVIAGILLAAIVLLTGVPDIGSGFVIAVIGTVLLNTVAVGLHFKAIKLGDISIVSPLLSFTPIFAIATSFVMLGELPTALGLSGLILVVIGSYILHWNSFGESIVTIYRRLREHKATLYILAVAAIFSVSANFDKMASVAATPIFASMIIDLALGIALLTLAPLHHKKSSKRAFSRSVLPWFLLIGALFAVGTWAQNTAFTLTIVPYASAAIRSSVVISVIYGAYILNEGHIKWRFCGAVVMLLGIALLAF